MRNRRHVMFACLCIAAVGLAPLLDLSDTLGVAAAVSETGGVTRAAGLDLVKYLDLLIRVATLIIAWFTRPAEPPAPVPPTQKLR